MALHPSDDLTYDVSSDRMTFAVLVGGDGVLHELPDAANGAPASAERGMCRELLQAREQDSYTASNGALPMAGLGKPLHMRSSLPRAGTPALHWALRGLHRSRSSLGGENFAAPFGVESAMRAPATLHAARRKLYLQQEKN